MTKKKRVKKTARQPKTKKPEILPCPCGASPDGVGISMPQGSQVGHASCKSCGVWGVDFLIPKVQDKAIIITTAIMAWNGAPRA